MNLIEKFENKPFQDVGTFNAIFAKTPILGEDARSEVRIGRLINGDLREVFVNDKKLFLNLNQKIKKVIKKRIQKKASKLRREEVLEEGNQLSSIFKKLSAYDFFVFSAIKEVRVFYGVGDLAQELKLCRRTAQSIIKKLERLNLVNSEKIVHNGVVLNKLTIDEGV